MNHKKYLKIASSLLTVSTAVSIAACSAEKGEPKSETTTETEAATTESETESTTPTGDDISETVPVQGSEETECGVVCVDEFSADYIFIAKDENGEWYEVVSGLNHFLDVADNKLYYSDGYTLKYIDIKDPELQAQTLFEFKKWYVEEWDIEDVLEVSEAVIIDNTMYFSYNSFCGGEDTTDGLLKIDLNAASLDEAEQFIPVADIGSWLYLEKENAFYYLDGSEKSTEETLYKYDPATDEKTIVMTGVSSYEIEGDKMLLLTNGGLKLMDMNTGDVQIVSPQTLSSTGSLWSFAELHNGEVYYLSDHDIIRYNNGNNIRVWTVPSKHFYGFEIVDTDIIRILYDVLDDGSNDGYYVVNGEKTSDLNGIADITVKMKDGSTETFTKEKVWTTNQIIIR